MYHLIDHHSQPRAFTGEIYRSPYEIDVDDAKKMLPNQTQEFQLSCFRLFFK